MSSTTVDIKTFAARLGQLERTEIRRGAINGLQLAAQRGKNYLVSTLIPQQVPQPVDRADFKGGWQVEPLPDGAMLHNDVVHALFIEYGVRGANVKPGRKMIDALTEWAMRKGLASDAKEARGIAWAVANAARKRGIFNRNGKEGLGLLATLVREHLPGFIKEECEREIARAIARTLGG